MIETLGQYRILERLGEGNLGDVYRARDTRLGRTVMLTIVRQDITRDSARRKRFLDDARAATTLSHPNIAILYEVADEEPMYLAAEFVSGGPLRAMTDAGPLHPRRAVDLAVQLADALAEAHAEGLVHGRLSTDTIVVTAKGSAKIVDFGLAHWSTPSPSTEAHASEGTQESGQQADLRCLGLILLDMLSGTPRGGLTLDATLPAELRLIVDRTLNPNPERQYQAAATLAAELRSIGAILDVRAASEPSSTPAVERDGRRLAGWILAAIMLAAIAWLIWAASRPG